VILVNFDETKARKLNLGVNLFMVKKEPNTQDLKFRINETNNWPNINQINKFS
jgi:hypothetical protein